MKKILIGLMALACASCSTHEMRSVVQPRYDFLATTANDSVATVPPTVYVTREITPQSLVKIYEALGVKAEGHVAVKISTGESEKTGYLRPDFIGPLVKFVDGTIVECNTAYPGNRNTTEEHLQVVEERGFTKAS